MSVLTSQNRARFIPAQIVTGVETRIRIPRQTFVDIIDDAGFLKADGLPTDWSARAAFEVLFINENEQSTTYTPRVVYQAHKEDTYLMEFNVPNGALPSGAYSVAVEFMPNNSDLSADAFIFGEKFVLDRSSVYVGLAGSPDLNSDRVILSLVRLVIRQKLEGRADILSYSIGGRQINTLTLKELYEAENFYAHRVEAKAHAKTGGIVSHRVW